MLNLAQQRCFNHPQREAAVRCPGCRRFFCRECVSEHEQRFLCASCIADATTDAPAAREGFAGARRAAQFAAGLAVVWCVFYFFGRLLLTLPSEFHAESEDAWLYFEGEGEGDSEDATEGEGGA